MKNDLLNIEEALSLSQAEIRQLYKEHKASRPGQYVIDTQFR